MHFAIIMIMEFEHDYNIYNISVDVHTKCLTTGYIIQIHNDILSYTTLTKNKPIFVH